MRARAVLPVAAFCVAVSLILLAPISCDETSHEPKDSYSTDSRYFCYQTLTSGGCLVDYVNWLTTCKGLTLSYANFLSKVRPCSCWCLKGGAPIFDPVLCCAVLVGGLSAG